MVSIVLPNYNHAQFLQQRLDSIFNQTYQDFEVIVLDDASSDTSSEILKLYKNHPKVSHFIINNKNSGSPFKQWIKGLKLAKGDYIWIAESDDDCDLNFLESQLEMLQDADVSVAKTLRFTENTVGSEVKHHIFRDIPDDERILFCPILNVSSVVFKAELLKNVVDTTFDSYKIIGDRVFYFEYFRNVRISFNPKTINYFRQSALGISNLHNKSVTYFQFYFDEHYKFICYVKNTGTILNNKIFLKYIRKFYRRVRDKVSLEKKKSLGYLVFYIKYNYRLTIAKVKK